MYDLHITSPVNQTFRTAGLSVAKVWRHNIVILRFQYFNILILVRITKQIIIYILCILPAFHEQSPSSILIQDGHSIVKVVHWTRVDFHMTYQAHFRLTFQLRSWLKIPKEWCFCSDSIYATVFATMVWRHHCCHVIQPCCIAKVMWTAI